MRKQLLILLLILLITVPSMAQEESISLDWPPPVYHVSGATVIGGTVNPPDLQSYFLEASAFDPQNPDAEPFWIPVSLPSSAPVTDGVLATWDTTVFTDGFYQLRLNVRLQSGESVLRVVGPLRVANELEQPDGQTQAVEATPAVVLPTIAAATPTTAAPETPEVVARPNPINQLPVPVGGHVITFNEGTVDYMQQAGMTWMKWQIPYVIGDDSLINVARDRVNFAHENGFRVLLSVKGQKEEMAAVGQTDYFPQYAAFLARIAELQPEAIQVWNEQNLDREWPNGQVNAASYVEMLSQAYEAIKAVDESIMVVTGAPAPTGFFGGCQAAGCDDDRYYAGMAQAGAAEVADCIGVHYNEGIVPPTATSGDPRNFYPTQYLPLMLQRAALPFRNSDIPLCFSELGYLSPEGYGPLPPGFAWAANNTVQEQAEWLRDAVNVAASFGDKDVTLIIVWNVDFDVYTEDDPQGGFAIIRPDGTCPACETLASLRQAG